MSIQQIFESLSSTIHFGFKDNKGNEYWVDKFEQANFYDYSIGLMGSEKELFKLIHFKHSNEYKFATLLGSFLFEGEFKWEWLKDLKLLK